MISILRPTLVRCLLLCVLATAGCRYAADRCGDFADIFRAELTIGPGFDIHAQATGLIGTGFGQSSQWGFVMDGRYVGFASRDSGGSILSASSNVTEDLMGSLRGTEEYDPPQRSWFLLVRYPPFRPFLKGSERVRLLDVEVGASVIVGAHVGVSPIELVDFLLGFTTLDICSDDPEPVDLLIEEQSPTARVEPAAAAGPAQPQDSGTGGGR